jgi:hypothetical protein
MNQAVPGISSCFLNCGLGFTLAESSGNSNTVDFKKTFSPHDPVSLFNELTHS